MYYARGPGHPLG